MTKYYCTECKYFLPNADYERYSHNHDGGECQNTQSPYYGKEVGNTKQSSVTGCPTHCSYFIED